MSLGSDISRGAVPRADVAAVLAVALDVGGAIHRQWNVVAGDTPVADAVQRAAEKTTRTNGFQCRPADGPAPRNLDDGPSRNNSI